jgi:hypothetical protein
MAAPALTDLLRDFGSRPAPVETFALIEQPDALPDLTEFEQAATEIEQRIEAAALKAEQETSERISRIYEDTLQAEREKHAAEIAELRAALGADATAAIAASLAEFGKELSALTTAAAARILATFVGDQMQQRSIERLALLIEQAIADREAVRIQIRGPQYLFEPLTQALGERAIGIEFVEAGGLDLAVSVDGSLFETRLAEWSAALEEAVR